jgi:beta-lactamase class A
MEPIRFLGYRVTIVFILCLTVSAPPTWAQGPYPDLRNCFDPELQNRVEGVLAKLGLDYAANRKLLSLALVDITDLKHPRVAAVNGNHMVYAASLPKLAILLGAFKEIEAGRMKLDPDTRQSLTDMIRVSSNVEASKMLRKVGPQRIADILQTPDCQLYDPETNGGLWCGKEYGKAEAWKRDPLHNLSHGATALQTARFYYLLETHQLVSPELSQEMKRMLANPGVHHKFVKGLKRRPGAKLYRKSGTWKTWHADSAMVEYGNYRYIVVALAESPQGGKWLERLIVPLHDLVVKNPSDS